MDLIALRRKNMKCKGAGLKMRTVGPLWQVDRHDVNMGVNDSKNGKLLDSWWLQNVLSSCWTDGRRAWKVRLVVCLHSLRAWDI